MDRLLSEFWPLLLPALLGFAAVYLAAPKVRGSKAAWGALVGGVALAFFLVRLAQMNPTWQEEMLFLIFSAIALGGGFMLITQKNPAHAALSFTLVIVSTCGLFLLNGAPFLMAATLIIYAGAIVVTFLFVLMLAQQEKMNSADSRTREPFLACVAGFVLVGAMAYAVQRTYAEPERLRPLLQKVELLAQARDGQDVMAVLPTTEAAQDLVKQFNDEPFLSAEDKDRVNNLEDYYSRLIAAMRFKRNHDAIVADIKKLCQFILDKNLQRGSLFQPTTTAPRSRVPTESAFSGRTSREGPEFDAATGRPKERLPAANVEALGRSLFTDYLIPVLMAGVLLLVATIGAIAIAGRRGEVLK